MADAGLHKFYMENIVSSPQKVDLGFSGFIWDYLSSGVVYLDYLLLNAFHIVNIISLTSLGRACLNLESKIQIKSSRRFQVFVLGYKRQWEKMGTMENLEK